MAHEIVSAFARAGLPLRRTLAEMLDEHFSHHTERRGCGYTQATRHLSSLINAPRDPLVGPISICSPTGRARKPSS